MIQMMRTCRWYGCKFSDDVGLELDPIWIHERCLARHQGIELAHQAATFLRDLDAGELPA